MTDTGPPLLEVRDLSVRRGSTLLLDRVSLAVAPGSIAVVVGPNGAGKTTLLTALLGEVEFTGRIQFHWRGSARIGIVPQTVALDRALPLTVAEFLALSRQRRPICLGISRPTRQRIDRLLKSVGLERLESRRLDVLSRGEIQRLLLANALHPEPELLLLDEPSTGIDVTTLPQIEALLLEVRRAGTTVLMVSHDPAQVRRLADSVITLPGAGAHA